MTLEELKALWDTAKAAAEANPEDEDLKKAESDAQAVYEKAKAEAESEDDDDDDDDPESALNKLSAEDLRKQIKNLRKENAGHRTKNKSLKDELVLTKAQRKKMLEAAGIVDDNDKPEEKLKSATEQNNSLAFRNAILETAIANGIPTDKVKYFSYLVTEATSELEEGDELPEEKLAEIIKECKGGKSKASSTVQRKDKDGNPIQDPPAGEDGEVTYAQFLRMGPVARSKLYLAKPALYEKFYAQARAKKQVV